MSLVWNPETTDGKGMLMKIELEILDGGAAIRQAEQEIGGESI